MAIDIKKQILFALIAVSHTVAPTCDASSLKDKTLPSAYELAAPGNILVNYEIQTSSPPLPKSVVDAATQSLNRGHLDAATIQNQLDYIKARSVKHEVRENAVYWTDGGSRFLWRRNYTFTWSDGLSLRHAVVIPKLPSLVDIFPINNKTDVSLVQGFAQEPLLGFWQPLQQEYVVAPKRSVRKSDEGVFMTYRLQILAGGSQTLNCQRVYDALGRLTKLKIDDDVFEYRNFRKLGRNFYLPKTVVWRRYSSIETGNDAYRYILQQSVLNAISIRANIKFSEAIDGIKISSGAQVHDARYQLPSESTGIRYVYDGSGTIDDASKKYYDDPYSAIPPDKILGDPNTHRF